MMTALPLALALAVLLVHAAAAGARHACAGASVNLSATQCDGWIALFDATTGTEWSECNAHRLDPCGCGEDADDDGTPRVQCSGDVNRSITHVDLSNMGLRGTIPRAIANLTAVEYFNIGANPGLNGTIPPFMALKALRVLYVYSNPGLHGTIPPLTGLTALQCCMCPPTPGSRHDTAPHGTDGAAADYAYSNPGLYGTIPPLTGLTALQRWL